MAIPQPEKQPFPSAIDTIWYTNGVDDEDCLVQTGVSEANTSATALVKWAPVHTLAVDRCTGLPATIR